VRKGVETHANSSKYENPAMQRSGIVNKARIRRKKA